MYVPGIWLFLFSSRRRHTICALVTGVQRVLFRSMVLDRDSPAGELEDIGIVEHEGPAFLRGRLDDAGAVASALAINHAEGFATELLVDDRLVSRLCEKRLENDISVRVDGPLDHGVTRAPGATDDDAVGETRIAVAREHA